MRSRSTSPHPRPASTAVWLAVLAVLVTTVSPEPAHAAVQVPPTVGVQVHATWLDMDEETLARVLDELASADVEDVRVDIGWVSLEPDCAGCYDPFWVERVHDVLDVVRDRGFGVLVTLWRTPSWAGSGGETGPPADPADYGRFAHWFAQEYGDQVDAYEVWNEPNNADFFAGSVGDYVALLRAAYAPLRAADPTAEVVFGGPTYNDTDFLEAAYATGAAGSFDVMATHPYQGVADAPPEVEDVTGQDPYLLTHVAAVHALMEEHGDGDTPIWFTEFGWTSSDVRSGVQDWERGVTETEQADYLVRTLELVADRFPFVEKVYWYSARDRDTGEPRLDNYGLLRRDLSPKPALLALRDRIPGAACATESSDVRIARDPDRPYCIRARATVRRYATALLEAIGLATTS